MFYKVKPWNGDFYEREWLKDTKQGKGVYNYANGNSYDGNWTDDSKSGKGIFTFANGLKTLLLEW